MSKEALQRIAEKLKQLEQKGRADSEEYEDLSDDYQSLAISELPLWDELDDDEPNLP